MMSGDLMPCMSPFVRTDEQSREEHIAASGNPMAGESYDYYGRDGVKGPKAVPQYTNMHIGDQAMESLISIGEAYADKIIQPTLVLYGTSASTAICSTKCIEKLTNTPEVLAVDEFEHVDF